MYLELNLNLLVFLTVDKFDYLILENLVRLDLILDSMYLLEITHLNLIPTSH